MGGKGETATAPPPVTTGAPEDAGMSDEMVGMLMQAMMAQTAAVAAAAQPPQMPTIPDIYTTPEIDWKTQIESLNQKAAGEAAKDRARKKGVLDTIGTSSLLDEEEPDTTSMSVLTGKVK